MIFSSKTYRRCCAGVSKLPGYSKKTALRMVLQLLKMQKDDVDAFTGALSRMRTSYSFVIPAIIFQMQPCVPYAPTPAAIIARYAWLRTYAM